MCISILTWKNCWAILIRKRENKQTKKAFSSVQSLIRVRLFATAWIAARQASLSITNSQSLLKLMPIESVMPSSHLILCRPLLLLSPIHPSIRVFSNELTLCMRWPKYWSLSFIISPSVNTQDSALWLYNSRDLTTALQFFFPLKIVYGLLVIKIVKLPMQ